MSKNDVENLTHEVLKLCNGKDAAAVVGVGLTIIFNALDSVDSFEMRMHFARSLRDIAWQIDINNSEGVH